MPQSTFVNVFNVQRYSTSDGPGIRTTVFFKGCPLHCPWCHNPEGRSTAPALSYAADSCIRCGACSAVCKKGVHIGKEPLSGGRENCLLCGDCAEACPTGALEMLGKRRTVAEVFETVMRDREFYADGGGLTVSGGEPFMQTEALVLLLRMAKEAGISTAVETSGFASENSLRQAAKYTDIFLFDIKHTDRARHSELIGCELSTVLSSLALLDSLSARVVLRCPIIPEINASAEHLAKIGELAERFACVESVELMPYHSLWHSKAERIGAEIGYGRTESMSEDEGEGFVSLLRRHTKKPVKQSRGL